MAKGKQNIEATAVETTIELRIAKAIAPVKRTSERIIGITHTDYVFTRLTYDGTTVRPEPITPLERAVVGIIDIDGSASLNAVGKILGLDVEHDTAENAMLLEAINKMKEYGMLEGDESYFALTEKGKVFAKEGARPVTYNKSFCISFDKRHPDYLYLGADFSSSNSTSKSLAVSDERPEDVGVLHDLETIKSFAEIQAPGVQNEKNRFILQAATLKSSETLKTSFYVIILQSIRNEGDFRAFVYDDNQKSILPHLSELIQSDKEWTSRLLEQCINSSLQLSAEDGGWTLVPSGQEKNAEQIAIEAELVKCEDDETEGKEAEGNELERLHKKAIYDQVSFEFELNKIFKQDNPDEVWIISPFVSWSFVKVRAKQFEPLLKANKRIFIAYSEPYENRATISPDAEKAIMKEINRLSRVYPNFYYVELPKFHTKQVLEVKNGQCVLFNGSFNVLSFDNVSGGRKVSREEMALVHHQVAISKHQEYINTFARIYEKRILEEIAAQSDPKAIAKVRCDRIDYLHQISENKDGFIDFYTEYDEKNLQAKNNAWYDASEELIDRMNKAIIAGAIDNSAFKEIHDSYSALIKASVTLTVSSAINKTLDSLHSKVAELPKNEDNKKRKEVLSVQYADSLSDKARAILSATDFSDEENITLFVAALNYLYANRAFKSISEGTNYLSTLIGNSGATSIFSVFDYMLNRNGIAFDVTIGVGGYLFRLNGICRLSMEAKLSALKKPYNRFTRLETVNLKNLEKTFKNLIEH